MDANSIPDFDDNGNVPIGFHPASLSEYKNRFVDGFPQSETRCEIFSDYISYAAFLFSYKFVNKKWMVGSFTSAKENPGDIDMVVLYDGDKFDESLESDDINKIFLIDSGYKKMYHHSIYVPIYPEDHPLFENYTKALMNKWEDFFCKDRMDNPRGFVTLDLLSPEYHQTLIKEVE